jgi:hypothetical protein
VARSPPGDFLVTFTHRHHREAAVAARDFLHSNLDFRIRPWQLVALGERHDLYFHVRLCLEGIPPHAWNENIAKRSVARACVLDYVEEDCLSSNKADARCLNLWAWTGNPSDIPKIVWLTITGRSMVIHDNAPPPPGQCGLTFRVLVHIDLVESPSGQGGRLATRSLPWRHGVVDGERGPRDRHDPPPTDHCNGSRRWDREDEDDEDGRRGRRQHKARSWSSRLFRSVSRAPHDRDRDRSEPRRDAHDRGSNTGGRRHHHVRGPCTDGLAHPPGPVSTPHSGPAWQDRGRSRERHSPRRHGHRNRSSPRGLHQRHAPSPAVLLGCSPGSPAGAGEDRWPSPRPPLHRVGGDRCGEDVPQDDHNHSAPPPQTVTSSPGLMSVHAERRFLPGRVYRRRARSAPPEPGQHSPATIMMDAAPGVAVGSETALVTGMETAQQATTVFPELGEPATTTVASFISNHTCPVAPPLLQELHQAPPNLKTKKKQAARATRKSMRLAAIAWPRGNIQERARQVLLKRLGLLPKEGQPSDQATASAALETCINLFKGPLSSVVLQSLMDLCGIIPPQGPAAQV